MVWGYLVQLNVLKSGSKNDKYSSNCNLVESCFQECKGCEGPLY